MMKTHPQKLSSAWRWATLTISLAGLAELGCAIEQGRSDAVDDRAQACLDWAPGRCGRPSGCFAEPDTCEDIYGGPKTCADGSWSAVATCGGDDGGGDGQCLPWASGRCGRPDGCFAEPGTCENIYGGPRSCDGGGWTVVASCGGGGEEPMELPDYGVGLDPGSMVNGADGHIWFHDPAIYDLSTEQWLDNFELMQMSGAQYVRVNFIRPAGFSDAAWLELYDPLIDELLDEGIIPYALVGREAVAQPFPDPWLEQQGSHHVAVYDENAQRSWIRSHYAPAFRDVVDHFEGRIQVFESYNEPDNWFLHGPDGLVDSPRMRDHVFAVLLDEIYDEVKGDGGHDDVILVSGPLVGHDHGGFAGAAGYLRGAIQHGESTLGWGGSHYPFDGVGYHIYVASHTTDGHSVSTSVANSVGAVHSMLQQEIGGQASTRGELWISEFGWATPAVSEHTQRDALEAAFDYFRGQSWRIRMASWYQVGDTPSEGGFGLIRPHYMDAPGDPTRFKLAWTEFQEQASLAAP